MHAPRQSVRLQTTARRIRASVSMGECPTTLDHMRTGTIWTVLGVIGAIVIAWFLVNVLFSLIAFAFKLVIVGVVAVIVYFVLRGVFRGSGAGD